MTPKQKEWIAGGRKFSERYHTAMALKEASTSPRPKTKARQFLHDTPPAAPEDQIPGRGPIAER